MRNRVLAFAFLAGLLATGAAFSQDRPKNLKVLPSTMSKAEVKKVMKGVASALGVECDHCHNLDDMSQDTKLKETARGMMKMVAEINKEFFAGKNRVGCITCHNGNKTPKGPAAPK